MIDFLIIGGGIAGVSAAARLSALGSVTVLEREDAMAYHASGRSAALYEAHYGNPSTVALNVVGLDFHRNADVLSPRGLMLVGNAAEADLFDADVQAMQMQPITMDQALALIPVLNTDHVDRAAYDPDAWDIDTDKLIQTFAKQARGNEAQIVTKAEVTAITRSATGWTVSTSAGDYEARHLVNAAGAWVDVIASMAGVTPLGFQPLRRSMARIPAPDGHDLRAWPMVFGAGEGWYAKPDAGALIVSPAEEDPADPHDAYADDMVLAEGLARYAENVTTPVTRVLASWAGLRTFAPDRNLVLGPDPVHPGFIWCAGQGGYGMQSSPGASQLLADLISGAQPAIAADMVAALTPDRFR
ncbi:MULTISPECIES: FAD-dependent oxidoreductase [unclassified Yoonia]|uniref:NAD(P)/FAD-dependent oxidoreductase n=1 Tax=unclassified Yoonia TaxID=2629118 RepID=UPI002B003460|nr:MULTISPECIES: FAD-dependent oxidoreductase [unclassified Yoonia]